MRDKQREDIETKIAYLERANNELSDVLIRQQLELRSLERRLEALSDQMRALQADDAVRPADDERPPHY